MTYLGYTQNEGHVHKSHFIITYIMITLLVDCGNDLKESETNTINTLNFREMARFATVSIYKIIILYNIYCHSVVYCQIIDQISYISVHRMNCTILWHLNQCGNMKHIIISIIIMRETLLFSVCTSSSC